MKAKAKTASRKAEKQDELVQEVALTIATLIRVGEKSGLDWIALLKIVREWMPENVRAELDELKHAEGKR